jgi:hypothetical protein
MKNLEAYLDAIKADYAKWLGTDTDIRIEMIRQFNESLRVIDGNKYLKVVKNGSVHSFICKRDMGKFTTGDVLKAASWAAPARNFARANLFQGDFSKVRWTGWTGA